MAEYAYQVSVNADLLVEELQVSSLAGLYDGLSVIGGELKVSTTSDLSAAEKTILDGLVAAHDEYALSISQRVNEARRFGKELLDQYQNKMIAEGVVQAGKAHEVSAKMRDAIIFADVGNLYALDDELATVQPTVTFLEQSRIDEIRNEVREFLGLPAV